MRHKYDRQEVSLRRLELALPPKILFPLVPTSNIRALRAFDTLQDFYKEEHTCARRAKAVPWVTRAWNMYDFLHERMRTRARWITMQSERQSHRELDPLWPWFSAPDEPIFFDLG